MPRLTDSIVLSLIVALGAHDALRRAGKIARPAAKDFVARLIAAIVMPLALGSTVVHPAGAADFVGTDVPCTGFSGLARIGPNELIGIKDIKNFGDSFKRDTDECEDDRLKQSIFLILGDAHIDALKLTTSSSFSKEHLPSDLESVCAPVRLKDSKVTVLAAEASFNEREDIEDIKDRSYGRLFRIEVDTNKKTATVTGIRKYPNEFKKGPQFEGMICQPGKQADSYQIIMARREDQDNDRKQLVAFQEFSFGAAQDAKDKQNAKDKEEPLLKVARRAVLKNPSPMPKCFLEDKDPGEKRWRDFGELHFDGNTKRLWATSTYEFGKPAKVCSTIYELTLSQNCGKDPFSLLENDCEVEPATEPFLTLPKHRLEGLTDPPESGIFSASTEQEEKGKSQFGVVR